MASMEDPPKVTNSSFTLVDPNTFYSYGDYTFYSYGDSVGSVVDLNNLPVSHPTITGGAGGSGGGNYIGNVYTNISDGIGLSTAIPYIDQRTSEQIRAAAREELLAELRAQAMDKIESALTEDAPKRKILTEAL